MAGVAAGGRRMITKLVLIVALLVFAFCQRPPDSLEYRESTIPAGYERIIRAIDASRESRKVREASELRALIDGALRRREWTER